MPLLHRSLIAAVALACTFAVAGAGAGATFAATTASSQKVPVLGSEKFAGSNGAGWGHAHPKRIFNGGDPSGLVKDITWKHWGAKHSYGLGKTFAFKPNGGYYAKPVKIELRAENLGTCSAGKPAYTRLAFREAKKPGAALGKHWHLWSGRKTICKFGF
jgi:hypothetical protein